MIDVAWGLGFVVVAWVAFGASAGDGDDTRRVLVAVLVVGVGAAARGLHRAAAAAGKGEDPRYADDARQRAKGDPGVYALRSIYLTQAVALWFISLPVQVSMFERSEPGVLLWVGTAVWAVGLFFESVGDAQLAPVPRRPREQGPGDGPRAVALHAAPELLRRRHACGGASG